MDHKPVIEPHDAEYPARNSGPTFLQTQPSDPDSWFRKRLDYVRKEAQKDLQLRHPRPYNEK